MPGNGLQLWRNYCVSGLDLIDEVRRPTAVNEILLQQVKSHNQSTRSEHAIRLLSYRKGGS
jgi:hypothetical protein